MIEYIAISYLIMLLWFVLGFSFNKSRFKALLTAPLSLPFLIVIKFIDW